MEIKFRDGTKNKATVFNSSTETHLTFIFLPALGVRAAYYETFAKALSNSGYNAITIDWRGFGYSDVRASKKLNWGYKELIEDLKEWFDLTDKQFPNTKKIIVGHSLGGQLGSIAASRYSDSIKGLVLITACSVYYNGYTGLDKFKVRLAGTVFYPLSKLVGYFPGDAIGFGGKEARWVMRDWSKNGLTGKYNHIDNSFDYEKSLNTLAVPVLSLSIENDWLATKQAVENLYKKFSADAAISHLHLNEKESGIAGLNHFNWVKKPDYFIELIENWVKDNV